MSTISENLRVVEEGITSACVTAGRPRNSVQLIAVSKTMSNELIAEAITAGLIHFGENKVQEITAKQPAFHGQIRWHLIGHLQSNKAKKALPCCHLLHTLDSVELGRQVDRISGELGIKTRALLQVNISNDDAKYGLSPEDTAATLTELSNKHSQYLEIIGLMTIPVFEEDLEKTRRHFAHLRELRDHLAVSTGLPLPELSMGMSHDYQIAIEEGATLVRVGTSI
ncbi:MAG: YggS family pyridoxal phosphate-dependent enzyme, partial [Verrucomicrobiales bacterium]